MNVVLLVMVVMFSSVVSVIGMMIDSKWLMLVVVSVVLIDSVRNSILSVSVMVRMMLFLLFVEKVMLSIRLLMMRLIVVMMIRFIGNCVVLKCVLIVFDSVWIVSISVRFSMKLMMIGNSVYVWFCGSSLSVVVVNMMLLVKCWIMFDVFGLGVCYVVVRVLK